VTLDPRTPVLVGAGVADRHEDDPAAALEPVALMTEALAAAGADAGAPGLAARAGLVLVPEGFWEYPDPGRVVAAAAGAAHARTVLAQIGVLQTTLLGRAAATIAAGDADVVVVVGGEAKHRARRAAAAGIVPVTTEQGDVRPDETLRPAREIHAPLELERGLVMPSCGRRAAASRRPTPARGPGSP